MPLLHISVSCDHTKWGEKVAVVGSWNSWDKSRFTTFSTTPSHFPRWHAKLDLPSSNASVEYKYVIVKGNNIERWEAEGHTNRLLDVSTKTVHDVYGQIKNKKSPFSNGTSQENNNVLATPWKNAGVSISEHTMSNVNSLDDLEKSIVQLSGNQRSWRQRLAYIRSLFTEEAVAKEANFNKFSIQHLATVSIYLTFLSTGQITCQEDGGHHRPNHHAHQARQIESALSAITRSVIDSKPASSQTQSYIPYVIRKIYPQLPSYSSQFTVSVPLTRIRDIAHRGDIPHDFKQEIKHTLQNKLHRCAGPEDLQTSAGLLKRINEGDFSHGLKEQFRIFHDELCAFFNASSLDDRLRYLQSNGNTKSVAEVAGRLLALKHARESAILQMEVSVELRKGIQHLSIMQPSSGKSSDDLPGEDMQKTRLADIALEEYAFLLLAGVAKDIENQVSSDHFPWPYALKGLSLSFQSMSFSGIRPEEAVANAAELSALEKARSSDNLHRTKAAIDRAVRFLQNFSMQIADVYTSRVELLGNALGVDAHAISVFAEAEIRSNVAFQASRMGDACARRCRAELALPPWDPLYIGSATGKIVFSNTLADLTTNTDEDVIAVCRHAQGDEDILPCIRGIILGRSLPHLSHLGVRARQQGVVFVCAEERDAFEHVWQEKGMKHVRLVVDAGEGLSLSSESVKKASPSTEKRPDERSNGKASDLKIVFDSSQTCPIPIEKATRSAVSSKNWFAGRLMALASDSDGMFNAPKGVALPHGMFQAQISKHSSRYKNLVSEYSSAVKTNDNPDKHAAELHNFAESNFKVEECSWREICSHFTKGTKVMVRSSANAEDLEDMSGAGLYDSIANVDIHSFEETQRAISQVWASLWTKRAASSRSAYQVAHEQVSMAVLIHEMVQADISFVAFSKDPVSKDDVIYVEVAIGMGETLASAAADGCPYRFRVSRESLDIHMVCFASYGEALVPGTSGLCPKVINYSEEQMTSNAEFRNELVTRIAKSILVLEKEFGGPQDVEGAISVGQKASVFVVQARPQIL